MSKRISVLDFLFKQGGSWQLKLWQKYALLVQWQLTFLINVICLFWQWRHLQSRVIIQCVALCQLQGMQLILSLKTLHKYIGLLNILVRGTESVSKLKTRWACWVAIHSLVRIDCIGPVTDKFIQLRRTSDQIKWC